MIIIFSLGKNQKSLHQLQVGASAAFGACTLCQGRAQCRAPMGAGFWGSVSWAVGVMPCCIAVCGPCLAWGVQGLLVISWRGLQRATHDGNVSRRHSCASPAALGLRSQKFCCAPWCDTRSVTGLRPDPGLRWQQAHQLLLIPTLPCKYSALLRPGCDFSRFQWDFSWHWAHGAVHASLLLLSCRGCTWHR